MRFTSSLVAAIVTGSSLVYAGLEDVKSGTHLTASNFDSSISGRRSRPLPEVHTDYRSETPGKNALVAFYAPWSVFHGEGASMTSTWKLTFRIAWSQFPILSLNILLYFYNNLLSGADTAR